MARGRRRPGTPSLFGDDESPAQVGSWPLHAQVALNQPVRREFTYGVPADLVPACVTCHGPGSHRRNPVYPALAGQYADYIRLQLSLFKVGHRGGTPFVNIMHRVASQLTEEQMRDAAAYYASISPGS